MQLAFKLHCKKVYSGVFFRQILETPPPLYIFLPEKEEREKDD